MKTRFLIPLFGLSALTFSACNLFGGLSKPSNDAQYLEAARACLDRGDFQCALDNYNALSNSQADIQISETSLTRLAQARIFSFSDLIGSLGSGLGSGSTFVTMANDLARRGAATESNRLLIQSLYAADNGIGNASLKSYAKFIAAISMVNEIMGEMAGADQTLRASDVVAIPASCDATSCLGIGGECDKPAASSVLLSNVAGDPTNLGSSLHWDGNASLKMLIKAASDADARAAEFRGSSGGSGIFSSINSLANIPGAEPCIRQQIVAIFGLN